MGRRGGGFWGRSAFVVAGAFALALVGLRERAHRGPCTIFRPRGLPLPMRSEGSFVSARRRRRPTSTAITSSCANSQTLETLAGAALAGVAARAFPSAAGGEFPERGARAVGSTGPRPNASYEVDLDIRAFELDAQSKEVNVDIAAWIVSLGSGRIVADQIFTLRTPVASTDPANVAAAMDQAASTVMT